MEIAIPVNAAKLTAGLSDLWTRIEQPIVPTKYTTSTRI